MAVRMCKVLAESDHACMDSLFPTRQRINGQLVYSANRLLGREVQTRYTRVWICKKEDLATIIVTLKKESIFRFSRWFEIKNLILNYPRETQPHDMKGIKRKVMHTTLLRQLLFTLQGFWSWKNNLRFLIYKNKYSIIYSHF